MDKINNNHFLNKTPLLKEMLKKYDKYTKPIILIDEITIVRR